MLVYGRNVAKEIFKRKDLYTKVRKIYFQAHLDNKMIKYIPTSLKSKIIIKTKKEIDSLAKGVHQGIIIDMEDYQYKSLSDILIKEISFVVILDHLEDPHNLGAIIRTAASANVDAIILPQDRQVSVSSTVVKASAGTIFNIDLVSVVNLKRTIDILKEEGFWIVGSALEGTDYRFIEYPLKTALVIGNEGKGISPIIKKSCDFLANIPMSDKVDSLNASVAAGIMIYEVVRSRK